MVHDEKDKPLYLLTGIQNQGLFDIDQVNSFFANVRRQWALIKYVSGEVQNQQFN